MRQFTSVLKRAGRSAVLTIFLSIFGVGISSGLAHAQTGPERDCDDNAVITCGALSISELKTKYQANAGSTQAIFREFGMTSASAFDGMVMGEVHKDGQVLVNNKVVATSAQTAGRQNMPGSTAIAGGAAYKRPPSVSFSKGTVTLPALVKLNGSTFQYAVLTSCGNPVVATPVAQPKPQPKPSKPNFEIIKQVRLKGDTNWVNSVQAKGADHVQFRIVIKNTGETDLTNVRVKDILPAGLGLVNGSLTIDGQTSKQNLFKDMSQSIGTIAKGQSRTLIFETLVANDVEACATNRLSNTVRVKPKELEEKQARATVEVCKPATPQVQAAVTPPPAAPTAALPDTGPSDLLAIFTAVSLGATAAYRVYFRTLRRSLA